MSATRIWTTWWEENVHKPKNNIATSFSCATALPVNTSHFEAGDGPILLDNVACNNSHANLSQCVHPQSIGIHECEEDNIAGVICLNISSTEVTNTLVTKKNGTDTKVIGKESQSTLFGSVGAALAVGAIATVAVVGIAVLLGTKQRKRRSVSPIIIILSVQFYFNYM